MGRPKGSRNKIHATYCLRKHPRVAENLTSSGGCLTCHKISAAEHYDRNKELIKTRASEWEKLNSEARKEIVTKSRRKHLVARRAYQRNRLSSNPEAREKRNKVLAKWQKENPGACKALENKRRTRKTKAGGFFTAAEWFTLCFAVGFKCLCCNQQKSLEADHVIPVSKGGPSWLWNIQPLCKPCNVRKGVKVIDYRVQGEINAG
jgi:5-methylcytosine-specific restriction endonuclease McrA